VKAKRSQLYFGRNILREAVAARASLSTLYVETRAAYVFAEKTLGNGISHSNLKIEEGIPAELKNEAHQGIAFRTNHDFYSPFDINAAAKHRFIILCNHVENIPNLGSIARCAAAFGAGLIIHEDQRSASMTASAVKSSAGCAFRIQMMKVNSMLGVAHSLRQRSYSLVGLDISSKSIPLYSWKPKFPLALVLGSEGDGIETDLKELCDSLVNIPMEGGVESLNVSHAAGIAMSWAASSRS